jgi:thymidylate synthase
MENTQEKQYLSLIENILNNGTLEKGRNGNTICLYGEKMKFDLRNNTLPLLTSKKVAWKTCLKELLWFINGSTNNKILKEQNVRIWNDNSSREFLDSVGLETNEEDDLGPVYGHQWRHFNAPYTNCHDDYNGKGIDQLQNIIEMLKDPLQRKSRRIILSAWNPQQLNEMALPPCHCFVQFHVRRENELICCLYQRSGDIGLGVPFNIASYSFLTHLLAKHCNLQATEFIHFIGNAHIYDDHIDALQNQLNNKTYEFPTINIVNKKENINDYNVDDFEILNYKHSEKVSMQMRK